MKIRTAAFAILALPVSTGPLLAQAWDAPSFQAPGERSSIGAYFVDPRATDFGVMLLARRVDVVTLGVRGGVFAFDDVAVVLGADVGRAVLSRAGGFPVDAIGTLGVGATFKDGTFARVPVGLSIGRSFVAGDWRFVPYVHPRLGLDLVKSNDLTDSDITFTTDVGADFYFGRLAARLGLSVGDHAAFAVGLAVHGATAERALSLR